MQNRRDMAYAVQTQTQQRALELILQAVEMTGEKNVVVSGGYGLNCVANYFYLDKLKDMGINLYVEPISNDAGTAIGAALMFHRSLTQDESVLERSDDLYLGPKYNIDTKEVYAISKQYKADVTDATNEDVIKLITDKNIVAVYQGRSENGPRALGNRSILYDPTDPNGKEHVNMVKRREYFRPFAGSILEEDVHEWFDLRGMESSPTMMYAVNCQPGVEEKIPAIIHVDGTCRIQTVNREQNENYYDLIKAFKDATGCPIIFNTSFNLGGEPLVETLEDALWTLQQSDIEYLYLPEHNKLLTILND
jgi:carbamoyltransferase